MERCRELWTAPTAHPGCAVASGPHRALKLPIPGSAGSSAPLWCSRQAVVFKACNTVVPAKEYILDWSWQESCPCRLLGTRSRVLVHAFIFAPADAAGELSERYLRHALAVYCGATPRIPHSLLCRPARRLTSRATLQVKLASCDSC